MSADAVAFTNGHFGVGVGPIFLDIGGCNGSEDNLIDCSHGSTGSCNSHNDDAGVRCQGRYNFILHFHFIPSYVPCGQLSPPLP